MDKTMSEFVREVELAVQGVCGRVVDKENTISSILNSALDSCIEYPFGVKDGRITIDTLELGDTPIISLSYSYRSDKRTYNGIGNRIESISVNLLRTDVSNLCVMDARQKIAFDCAKENVARLCEEISDLEHEIAQRRRAVKDLEDIMKRESYQ